jgi:hypothetical protein
MRKEGAGVGTGARTRRLSTRLASREFLDSWGPQETPKLNVHVIGALAAASSR